MSWSLALSTIEALPKPPLEEKQGSLHARPVGDRLVFDSETGEERRVCVYLRSDLEPGSAVPGPAIIAEDQTSTLVGKRFDAHVDGHGYIVLTRKQSA